MAYRYPPEHATAWTNYSHLQETPETRIGFCILF